MIAMFNKFNMMSTSDFEIRSSMEIVLVSLNMSWQSRILS